MDECSVSSKAPSGMYHDGAYCPHCKGHMEYDYYHYNQEAGITWVRRFVARFPHLVWLNPIPENQWSYIHGRSSIQLLRETVDMYPLSLEGLDAALKRLMVNR